MANGRIVDVIDALAPPQFVVVIVVVVPTVAAAKQTRAKNECGPHRPESHKISVKAKSQDKRESKKKARALKSPASAAGSSAAQDASGKLRGIPEWGAASAPAAAESAETGIAHQEREEVCAGAMLEDDVGKVLLRAAVAGGNGALLIVDPIHLHRADRVGRPRSQKIGTRVPICTFMIFG